MKDQLPKEWFEQQTGKSYLEIMIQYYHEGRYLETNYGLFIEQSGMNEGEALGYLTKKGIAFMYKPYRFKNPQGHWIHAKSRDMIILDKHLRPDKEYISQKSNPDG